MTFTTNELMLLLKLVKCERCTMSAPDVLPSYKAQLTKLQRKITQRIKMQMMQLTYKKEIRKSDDKEDRSLAGWCGIILPKKEG